MDLAAGELRKNGRKLKLQEQPFQVLASLLDRPGEVVTREELRERLWPGDTYVDFDRSLNSAVNRLREALDDSANQPRFVETLPRRGYRFVAPLERHDRVGDLSSPIPPTAETLKTPPGEALQAHLRRTRLERLVLLAALVVAVGVIVALWFRAPPRDSEAPLRKFAFSLGDNSYPWPRTEISPNGRYLAYVAPGEEVALNLWIQDLEKTEPRIVEGSQGAVFPFWSPTSEFIGFVAGGELKKISPDGGPAITLCRLPSGSSDGAWSPDGEWIVFAAGPPPTSLYQVSAQGGSPKLLFGPENSEPGQGFTNPHFLPVEAGERILLFTDGFTSGPRATYQRDSKILVQDLDSGTRRVLVQGRNAVYSPTGHILFSRLRTRGGHRLWALPFSLQMLQPTGKAFLVSENSEDPSVARDGTLAYFDRPPRLHQLVWKDRGGKKLAEIGQPQRIGQVSLSPSGAAVAVAGNEPNWEVWLHDTARNIKTHLTFDPGLQGGPAWSPQGDRIAFFSASYPPKPKYNIDILARAADGSGETEELVATPLHEFPTDWSRDGRYLVFDRCELYRTESSKTQRDLFYLKWKGDGSGYEEVPFLQTISDESLGVLSPTAQFLAYCSDESGQKEIYVRSFPEGSGRLRVSGHGGSQPRWSRDGKELFYVENDTLMAVSVTTGPRFSVGSPKPLFKDSNLQYNLPGHRYDVSRDGRRFVLAETLEPTKRATRVVQNWFAEFRDRQGEAR